MSLCIWITGLSGAGKSTIAESLSKKIGNKIPHEIIDGDVYRKILSPNAGYSKKERDMFRSKLIFITKLLIRNKIICILPLLSSTRKVRDEARKQFEKFVEIYLVCPIDICEKRDPKGHYEKVKQGILKDFVGIHLKYEEPANPEIVINTSTSNIDDSVNKIYKYIKENYSEILV